jgi:hypothetical protein
MIQHTRLVLVLLMLSAVSSAYGMNALKPHYYPWKPVFRNIPYSLQIALYGEKGIGPAKIFNAEHHTVNALQIYNRDQDAIAMLGGFSPDSPAGKLGIPIEIDNGVRGHFCPSGKFDYDFGLGFSARYTFPYNVSLAAYLPAYRMRLYDVCWQNLTLNVTDQDVLVRERLTDNFVNNVCDLGCGLDILGWERTGLGDLVLMFEWMKAFPQGKPLLKIVDIDGRVGLSLPTGLKRDENKILAIPFGGDGAVGVIFAGGLRVTLGDAVRAGFDIELDHFFDNTRLRRIKTARNQTDLLFLQKAEAHIDWGMTQQFNLYIDFIKIVGGLSVKVDYQFIKHGENEISVFGNCFSSTLANTAISLQDYTMHNLIASVNYDFARHISPETRCKPSLMVFGKVPFNGQYSIQATTVGCILAIDF